MIDEKVIAAVAGAVIGAIVKPFADSAVIAWRERKTASSIPTARTDALLGLWEGSGRDTFVEDEKPLLSFAARMNVTKSQPEVCAEGSIEPIGVALPPQPLVISGTFFDACYLQLNYRSSDKSGRIQPGVLVLALTPDAIQLSGYFAGFSPTRRSFVTGKIEFKKMGTSPINL